MEEKQLTISDVISMTADILSKIEVPVALVEKIGIPLAGCIGNLRKCEAVLMKAQNEEKETEKDCADNE